MREVGLWYFVAVGFIAVGLPHLTTFSPPSHTHLIGVELWLGDFLAKSGEEGVGIFAEGGSSGEEVRAAHVQTHPLLVTVATTALDVACGGREGRGRGGD